MKAHVIGIPGSGKSTLARTLAERYGIVNIDLDDVVYGPYGERSAREIARLLEEIRSASGWITEGAYGEEWLRDHLAHADVVVWLDLPLGTCLARILTRHLRAELGGDNPHPGWRRLWDFLRYTRRSAAEQRRRTRALLAAYGHKVVRCRSSGAVADVAIELGNRAVDSR